MESEHTTKAIESGDPVHQREDGWYFWDETWTVDHGPYDSEVEARQHLAQYCEMYL